MYGDIGTDLCKDMIMLHRGCALTHANTHTCLCTRARTQSALTFDSITKVTSIYQSNAQAQIKAEDNVYAYLIRRYSAVENVPEITAYYVIEFATDVSGNSS